MINGIIFDWQSGLKKHYEEERTNVEEILLTLRMKEYRIGLVAEEVDVSQFSNMLRKTGLIRYFDVAVMATSKGNENYQNCRERMKTTPQATLFVGDEEKCNRGKALGINTLLSNGELTLSKLENSSTTSLEETMIAS